MIPYFTVFCIIFILDQSYAANEPGSRLYSTRYDHLDIDTILGSDRLVTNYVDCLLNKRPCPPEGKDLKRILPEALRTKCGRCSPFQKEGAIKVITKLYYTYPRHYNALRARWDPTGEYHRRFEQYLRDEKYNVITRDPDNTDYHNRDKLQGNNIQTIPNRPTARPQFTPIRSTPLPQVIESQTQRPARTPAIDQSGTPNIQIPNIQPIAVRPSPAVNVGSPVSVLSIGSRFGEEEPVTKQPSVTQSNTPIITGTNVQSTRQTTRAPAQVTNGIRSTPMAETTERRRQVTPNVGVQEISQSTTSTSATTTSNPVSLNHPIIDHFFVSPNQQYTPNTDPFVGIINKISNTAQFFAGMIRGTVKVITGM